MRLLVVLSALFLGSPVFAQQKEPATKTKLYEDKSKWEREREIMQAFHNLDSALIAADTVKLKMLLADQLSFIHSNGLIETKQDLLKHISTEYLSYTKIEQSDSAKIVAWSGKKGGYWHDHTVNRNLHVVGTLEGNLFDVKLTVKEQWCFTVNSEWVLVWRQSVKAN